MTSEPTFTIDDSSTPIWITVSFQGKKERYPAARRSVAEVLVSDLRERLMTRGWPPGHGS